eukprot:1195493-Prorocentrum_minimum.AAC.2
MCPIGPLGGVDRERGGPAEQGDLRDAGPEDDSGGGGGTVAVDQRKRSRIVHAGARQEQPQQGGGGVVRRGCQRGSGAAADCAVLRPRGGLARQHAHPTSPLPVRRPSGARPVRRVRKRAASGRGAAVVRRRRRAIIASTCFTGAERLHIAQAAIELVKQPVHGLRLGITLLADTRRQSEARQFCRCSTMLISHWVHLLEAMAAIVVSKDSPFVSININ